MCSYCRGVVTVSLHSLYAYGSLSGSFFFKQKTAYEMRISDWSSDVCSSDLRALGASYDLGGHWRIGLNGSRTERAPTAEELFANGGHAGTQAYELGNPNFKLEKSWGLEATLHHHTDEFSFDASAFYNWFSNYIYENQVDQSVCEAAAAPSGREVDLPC